ncbi:GNAT family N-acetyltransferase [Pseudonocardiaceae bacterium YIM PH 21723]|nr:GNAT family N-acetyltransferase [Pseudonocardiaceae bacterium YIM PH 21723]
MSLEQQYLAAYDEQLRTDAEIPGASAVRPLGPLRLATYAGGRGFVTYPHQNGTDLAALVGQVDEHYRADPEITRVEWKARGHDTTPGLHEALVQHGFRPDEPESIMIGDAELLAVDVNLPAAITLRQISDEADVRAMCAMQAVAFDDGSDPGRDADGVLRRLSLRDGMELWVAEAEGEIISAGRLEPVPGTEFAGLWGGATLQRWRGHGIYRALTAVRARSALAMGKRLLHSDSTEFSRPILERSGLRKVSTTTPYMWTR